MASQLPESANISFTMIRDNLNDIAEYELPGGYRFRTFRDGDIAVWTELHLAAEPFVDVTPELFMQQFGDGEDVLSERMYFVETVTGQPVGTITAWWEKERYRTAERGRIHWVVVHPKHQGQGIAKAMMTQALRTMQRHHDRAMLETSSARVAAVKIYLDFGFKPEPDELSNPEIASAWLHLQQQLKHPALQESLANLRKLE